MVGCFVVEVKIKCPTRPNKMITLTMGKTQRKQTGRANYYQKHRSKVRKYQREYYQKNKAEMIKRSTSWMLENPERYKEIKKKWRQKHYTTPQGIYEAISDSARKRGREVSISKERFINWYKRQERKCFYCLIPEESLSEYQEFGLSIKKNPRLTIDRVDSCKPYTSGNLVLACLRCNITKNNFFTMEEMKEIAFKYITPRWKSSSN